MRGFLPMYESRGNVEEMAGVDAAIVERRAGQNLAGSGTGGLRPRTVEVPDQRGIADRFISQGEAARAAGFAAISPATSDLPAPHPCGLWQNHVERILARWVRGPRVPIPSGGEATAFAHDGTRADVGPYRRGRDAPFLQQDGVR